MATAIISGVFSFIGALLALYFQRRTMGENWLLQKRAEVFSKFMLDLQEFENERLSIDDSQPEKYNYSLAKICTTANMVCLYLPELARSEFRANFEGWIKFVPDPTGLSGSPKEMLREMLEPQFQCEKNIQRIFEHNLKCPKWGK